MLVDSSVLIAAVLSSRGGSFYILQNFKDKCGFRINEYIFEEVLAVLAEKFPGREDLRQKLFLLLGSVPIRILPDLSREEWRVLGKIINVKDAPILASALAESDYFLTLDTDFLASAIIAYAQKHGLSIVKPKAFIEILRERT